MKKIFLLYIFLFLFSKLFSQIPAGYYDGTEGLTGLELKTKLHAIIKNHTVIDYNNMNYFFSLFDKKSDGTVWDIYSDIPGGTPPYSFAFSQTCGNYNSEGDCWNKEHSFPQSWFNGNSPMYSDFFHIYPTDGTVNGKRGNNPYGKIAGSASWTSQNGSKLGINATPGYSGTVFEPIDAYKGDLARSYFYMAVRYYNEDTGWPGSNMVTGAEPKPWSLALLRQWDTTDVVSQKEIDRNNGIYDIQHNRNPFIDHPEFVNLIWAASNGIGSQNQITSFSVYPNPASEIINVNIESTYYGKISIKISDVIGNLVCDKEEKKTIENFTTTYNISEFERGIYYLQITTDLSSKTWKVLKQ